MKGECVHCAQGVNHHPRWCDECVFEMGSADDIAHMWRVIRAGDGIKAFEAQLEAARASAVRPVEQLEPAPASYREAVAAAFDDVLDVASVFAPGGPLARPGFEARPGQVKLSEEIYSALHHGAHVVAEGPCGIGKSKAYGVPASYLASQGRKVLIVTASIALQDQLVTKDLPELAKELPWSFTFELMKGRSNYLCNWMLSENDDAGLEHADRADFEAIKRWGKETKDGDRAKLPIVPSAHVWSRFSVSTDDCLKKKCDFYGDCHAQRAKDRATTAGVVVTNYHMLMLHLAMGGFVLPDFDAVILDEAHEAASIARELLGFTVSEYPFKRLAKEAEKRGYHEVGAELREQAAFVFGKLARFAKSPKVNYASFLRWAPPIPFDGLKAAVDSFISECPTAKLAESGYAERARDTLEQAMTLRNPDLVVSIDVKEVEGQEPRAKLVGRYVEPGPELERLLWSQTESVAAVSATLTTDNSFKFVRKELGMPADSRECMVESPFDFRRQAMLVLPEKMPEPNSERFETEAAYRLSLIAEAADGRTMGLFTSRRALHTATDYLRRKRWHVLAQGDAPVAKLVHDFKNARRPTVLLGVASLWTGVDVQGEALSAVVIDRIPFANPDDPVSKRVSEADPRGAFSDFTVPLAILQFRQGVGRLVRSSSDRGIVAVLDPRMTSKGYGKRFLRSVPEMQRGTIADIRGFLNEGKNGT